MKKVRFSKKAMIQYLHTQAAFLQKEYKFAPNNGWSQTKERGDDVNRAYGEWETFRNLITLIESGCLYE